MFGKVSCIGLTLIVLASMIECKNIPDNPAKPGCTKSSGRALKKHPGCIIWWFLPGCVLGDRIAVDPFGIYPWKKFCRKYSDLQTHDKCKGKVPQIKENDEIGITFETNDVKEKQQLSESSVITDINSNVEQYDNNLTSYIANLEELERLEEENESNSVLNNVQEIKITKQRPKRYDYYEYCTLG